MTPDSVFAEVPDTIPVPGVKQPRRIYGGGALGRLASAVRYQLGKAASPARNALYRLTPDGRRSATLLSSLHNTQAGATGVIVCSGPSLANTPLDLVGDHPYILLNRGSILRGKFDHDAAALCVHDPHVIDQFMPDIAATPSPLIASAVARRKTSRRQNTAFLQIDRRWRFATRLSTTSHHGFTVTFWALELAFHLGWERVLIVGMDHNFKRLDNPSKLRTITEDDMHHFDKSYYPVGTRTLDPDVPAIEYSYALARDAWESAGRKIVDCTVGGECRVFERGILCREIED